MRWIREHKMVSILIAVVVALCVIMLVSYETGGKSGTIGNATETAVTKAQSPLSNMEKSIKNSLRGIFKFKSIVSENEKLKDQVNDLQQQVIDLTLKKNELQELQQLSNALNYESISGNKKIVGASIISMDGSNWFNQFTIDRGTESGIQKDDVVVNGDGLVGRIAEAGTGWSKVISIIDESNNVSFMVSRDLSLIGIVSGDSNGSLSGFMIDNKAGIIKGDTLVTSSMGLYPEGIKIGKAVSVEYDSDTQLKTVKIEPSVSFKSLQKVAVIL
ncbi:rod shape-determining protein MreC [Clostridium aminobutyricum]|uniref:Cell shape-determining protein MreC n=1 Tax=Clostridium aminobutyricum TaxID=33953 RepID=A0A939D7R5_CLOAM|nr:rod shape-determining protein MreC [Clostridium aminobutyricum]MBN7772772.1 rod shape-determining protein MreC [Clostridium aminobutyricum]